MSMHALIRLTAPVDPDVFLEMVSIFQDTASKPMPAPKRRTAGYYPTDTLLNRGIFGVMEALRSKGVDEQFEPIIFRLMSMSKILTDGDRFGRFIRIGADATGLSHALLKAAAVARIEPGDHGRGFDLDDVLAHAERFDEQAASRETEAGPK